MTVITKDPHMWFVATNDKGSTQTLYNNEHYGHNYPFTFEINFSDTPTPQTNTVTAYNLSKKHRQFYKKKQKCYVAFNWGKTKKILAEGYISKVDVNQSDGTTDTLVISFTEGTDYNNVKANSLKVKKSKEVKKYKTIKETISGHYKVNKKTGKRTWVPQKTKKKRVPTRATKTIMVNKTYRKGTDYLSVIKGVATQAGIKIDKIQLQKNPLMKKAYTAKGKPLTLLKILVKKTGSSLTYIKGKLEIVDPKAEKKTWYEVDDQDLIQPPTYNEGSDDEKGTWEVTTPLLPDVSANTGVHLTSKYIKGYFYVKAGQHTFDIENAQTQMSLLPM